MSSEKRLRTALVAIRMTPAERQRVTAAASITGASVGTFIRNVALDRATETHAAGTQLKPSPPETRRGLSLDGQNGAGHLSPDSGGEVQL